MKRPTVKGCRKLALVLALAGSGVPDTVWAELRPPHNYRQRSPGYQICPPTYQPSAPAPTAPPRTGADGQTPTQRDDMSTDQTERMDGLFDQQQNQANQQAQQASPSTNSTASASSAASPNMIGDFFGGVGANCFAAPIFVGTGAFHPPGTLGFNDIHAIAVTGPGTAVWDPNESISNQFTQFGPVTPGQIVFDPDGNFTAVQNGQIVDITGNGDLTPLVDNPAPQDTPVYDVYGGFGPMICIPTPGTGVVGRVKLSENVSPIPRDRVFMNYSHFANVPFLPQGVDVNRFVPGFEKTLFGGIMSAEMRFPFASTLSPDIVAGGATSDSEVVFGNMSIIAKALIYQDCQLAIAGGIQVAVPTADDIRVLTPGGLELVHIGNEAVHLMPYVGALYTPNDRFFAQAFVQADFDANGHPVRFVGVDSGRIDDQNFLYLDSSFGYWLYRSCCCCDTLTGIAPIFEAHWNTSINDGDLVRGGAFQVGGNQDVNIVNLVFGSVFEFNNSTTLTAAYATPVSDDQDFDGEVRIIFNHRFGPQSRASRAQF